MLKEWSLLISEFRPPLGPYGGAEIYARIFAGLVVGRKQDQVRTHKHYDPTAQRFIQMLEQAIEEADNLLAATC